MISAALLALLLGTGDPVREAAELAGRGDDAGALARLAPVLASPDALFVRACAELDAGDLAAAGASAAKLLELAPEKAQGKVLAALIAERKREPRRDWAESFRAAWKAAGRPDLSNSRFLGTAEAQDLPSPLDLARFKGTPLYADLAAAQIESTPEASRVLLDSIADDTAEPIALARLSVVDTCLREHRECGPLQPALHARLKALSAKHADQLGVALWELLDSSPTAGPFTDPELAELSRLARRPTVDPDRVGDLYLHLRDAFVQAKVPDPRERALVVAMEALPADALLLLRRRARATAEASPASARRVADLLWEIGGRAAAGRTFVDAKLGSGLRKEAARISQDPARQRQAEQEEAAVRAIYGVRDRLALDFWPLSHFAGDFLDHAAVDEIAYYRSFAER